MWIINQIHKFQYGLLLQLMRWRSYTVLCMVNSSLARAELPKLVLWVPWYPPPRRCHPDPNTQKEKENPHPTIYIAFQASTSDRDRPPSPAQSCPPLCLVERPGA